MHDVVLPLGVSRHKFPKWAKVLFQASRYKVIEGGRGSGKSWNVARALLIGASERRERILCAREIQRTIKESVHRLLADQIEALGLSRAYEVSDNAIRCENGSDFIFAGLRTNVSEIKSLEGVDKCWVEEAQRVSERSWEILLPTIRKDGSQIWITFNPEDEEDPTSQRWLVKPPPPEECAVVQVNWTENPWFPEELRKEKDRMYRLDPETAAHVWGGGYRKVSAAQIFRGKYMVDDFEPQATWLGPYYGGDWGFSQDPTVLVKMWVCAEDRRLFIERESFGVGTELDDIAKVWLAEMPEAKDFAIRADSSRPETISHLNGKGLMLIPAKKWPGSVEDGVEWLKGLAGIVIHPRCKNMEFEAKHYKYKVDPLTGDVLRAIVDKHNHGWDAVRYAMEPAIAQETDVLDHVGEEVVISRELDEYDVMQARRDW